MSGLLDGIERELPPAVPAETKAALQTFRSRLEWKHVTRKRKRFERKLEACLQSSLFLRAASWRHIAKVLPPIVERAAATLEQARLLLARYAPNNSLQATRDGALSSASRFTSFDPACLSSGR
jgi:hypothetical protein